MQSPISHESVGPMSEDKSVTARLSGVPNPDALPSEALDYSRMLQKDAVGYLPIKLIPAVAGLASIVILTRNLDPEQYGVYSAVMAAVLLMNQIFGAWISSAVFYVYPDYQKNHDHEFKAVALRLQALASLIALVVAYVGILLITHNYLLALVGGIITVFRLVQYLMMTFLQSTRNVREQIISVVAQTLSQLALLCLLIFVARGKEMAALLAVLAGYMASIPVLARQTGISSRKSLNDEILKMGDIFRKLLSYGMPMCVWFFATQFYTIGDRILLQLMGSTQGLGQYASFRDLATGLAGFLTMPLLMASHPIIMSMWKNGTERSDIEHLITRNLILLTILFVPIFVVVDLSGSWVLMGMFGKRYLMGKTSMLLVVGSIYLAAAAMYVQKGLEVTGKTLQMATVSLIASVMSLVGDLAIIPHYGVLGAASIMVLVQIFYLLAVWQISKRILNPKIPISLLIKLSFWVIGVEVICRVLGSLPGAFGAFWASSLNRGIFIFVATCLLYLWSNEISSVLREIVRSVGKPLNWNC